MNRRAIRRSLSIPLVGAMLGGIALAGEPCGTFATDVATYPNPEAGIVYAEAYVEEQDPATQPKGEAWLTIDDAIVASEPLAGDAAKLVGKAPLGEPGAHEVCVHVAGDAHQEGQDVQSFSCEQCTVQEF